MNIEGTIVVDGEKYQLCTTLAKILGVARSGVYKNAQKGISFIVKGKYKYYSVSEYMHLVNNNRLHKKKEDRRKARGTRMTLCWSCSRASGDNQCSWAKSFQPVEGWEASKRILYSDRGNMISYQVINCPEYIKDPPRESIVYEGDCDE